MLEETNKRLVYLNSSRDELHRSRDKWHAVQCMDKRRRGCYLMLSFLRPKSVCLGSFLILDRSGFNHEIKCSLSLGKLTLVLALFGWVKIRDVKRWLGARRTGWVVCNDYDGKLGRLYANVQIFAQWSCPEKRTAHRGLSFFLGGNPQ